MIKERNNGSQSPRLSFLGFFVLGSASCPILSRLLFSSCPDSTFGAACLHPFYAASNIPSIPPYLIFLPIRPLICGVIFKVVKGFCVVREDAFSSGSLCHLITLTKGHVELELIRHCGLNSLSCHPQ